MRWGLCVNVFSQMDSSDMRPLQAHDLGDERLEAGDLDEA
jgi:hypothetical protein